MTVYQGATLQLIGLSDGFVELRFDRDGQDINKFDDRTVAELGAAVKLLASQDDLCGVLVTSAKASFIVGADIAEFEGRFRVAEDELSRSLWSSNEFFIALEDLPVPSVVALDGFALGGGCEMALAATYRVMSETARIGVPEVKLGLFPGFGGTVRLPRVASPAVAIEWILHGEAHSARDALACGIADAVCAPDALRAVALRWLHDAAEGRLDWRTRQAAKRAPVPTPASVLEVTFSHARAVCEEIEKSAIHQPAARMAIELMAETTLLSRDAAQWQECLAFSRVVRTQAGRAMVQTFLNDQFVKRASRALIRGLKTPLRVALPVARGAFGAFATSDTIVLCETDGADVVVRHDGDVDAACERAPCMVVALGASSRLGSAIERWFRVEHVVGLRLHPSDGGRALAEIVSGPATSDHAVACAVTLALALGATPVVVQDGPAPLLARLFAAMEVAPRRTASPGCAVASFGWPDSAPCAAHAGDRDQVAMDDEIVDRIAPLVVAAAQALESGMVATPAELDVAVSLGAGLPPYLGGPFQMADHFGLPVIVDRIERVRASGSRAGALLQPTPDMRERARTGRRYYQNGKCE